MKNLKISKKLIISYAVVLTLLIIGTVVSIFNLTKIGNQVEDFYNGPFMVQGAANSIDASFEEMQKSVYRAISNSDLTITNESISNATKASESIQSQMTIVKERFPGDQSLVTGLADALSNLTTHRETVLQMAAENKNTEAAAYMENNNIPLIEDAQEHLDDIIEFANNRGVALITDLRAARTQSIIMLVILGAGSVLVSVLFGVYITRSITRPVAELEKASQKLANGELDAKIGYESKDELGSLSNSMRTMVVRLSDMINDLTYLLNAIASGNFNIKTKAEESYVGDFRPLLLNLRDMNNSLSSTMRQINESSDQVASGSEQVSSGAQALSQGATEQASSVEELAASINEISDQVNTNAESALNASRKATETGSQIQQSNESMHEMIRAMGDITDSSNEIGKIIKTIEDIAFQTNILALNAAVEAARAGAAGKGFAVVADEVRNLASKSSEASKNTSALIESSLRSVENGVKIADETAQSLSAAVEGAKEVTKNIDLISKASHDQAESIKQVTLGIDQISSVVQTNSATAEESAASSEELSGQAQLLKSLISRFQLKEDHQTRDVAMDAAAPVPAHDRASAPASSRAYDNSKY